MHKTRAAFAVVSAMLLAIGVAAIPAGAAGDRSTNRMTIADLRHSVVPAYCQMPRQRLHHNKTAKRFLPKQGWINFRHPGQPIVAHLRPGRRNVVATYDCTAGGVGWPQVIVAHAPRGRLIDALYLDDYAHQEHSQVTGWHAAGHSVRMHWISYEGAGFDKHRHHSRITLEHGRLALHPIR
jgi:hypothetical protein